jgi:extracellular factor (EF) 3-hydroxypalmitic acid methyl ester biosynthesis protein
MVNATSTEGNLPSPAELDLIQSVLPYGQRRTCARGKELINTGEPSECFYFVEKGTLEVSYTAQRTPIVVALIGPGTFFGEIGFFDQLTRTRNIQASEDAQLRLFDHDAMDRLRSDDPVLYARFLEYVLRMVCGRFRQILSDRGPLTAYAASLSTGKEHFAGLQQLPMDLLASPVWLQVSQELEDFKARMFDLGYQLQADAEAEISPRHQAEGEEILNAFFLKIRQAAATIDARESADLIWGYVFKEVFPYLMRSRFFERAYYKPKGYAGDFYMIEMIYRNQAEGDGKLGRLLDGLLLAQVPARAVRGRRQLLRQTLDRLCRERLSGSAPIRILNLACGPCRELFDLIAQGGYSERIDALCVDIDAEALQFADQKVNIFAHQATVRFMNENVIKWAIGRVKQDFGPQDIIYSSGLCDYLDERLINALIRRCYGQLKPGGVLIIGNFSPANLDRPIMDHLLYWRLIYRDPEQLRNLFTDTPFGRQVEIIAETEGVNLFAVARKPVP